MFMSNIVCHSSAVSVPRGLGPVKWPALEIKMSRGFPFSSWDIFENAEATERSLDMSVWTARMFILETPRD